MFQIGSAVAHIKADISDFKRGIDAVKAETAGLAATMGSIGSSVKNFANQASVFGLATAGAVGLIGKAGVESAAKFEQYQIAYTTLLKDQKKAAEAIKNIQQDAAKTPFELAPLVMANQRLISAGVSAKDARKDILNLGDAISATGGGGAELERLSTNLQQIKAVGKASALDIKQFAFAGINVYKLLADSTGKTVEQVKDMDVSYQDLSKAFEKASGKGGMFEDAMIKQSKTLNGLISTLKDAVSLGLKDILINSGAFDVIRDSVAQLIPFIEALVPKIVAFFQSIPNNPTFIAIIDTLTKAFQALSSWVAENQELVLTFLKGLAIGLAALLIIGTINGLVMALLNPLTLVVLAVAALYTAWQTNFLGIQDIVAVFSSVWMSFWEQNKAIFVFVWDVIIAVLKVVGAVLTSTFLILRSVITGNWQGTWEMVKQILILAWEGIKNALNSGLAMIGGWARQVFDKLTQPFRDALAFIKDTVNKIKENLDFTKRHSPSILDIVNNGVDKVNSALSGLNFAPAIDLMPSSGQFAGAMQDVENSTRIVNQENIFNVASGVDARILSEQLAFDLRNI